MMEQAPMKTVRDRLSEAAEQLGNERLKRYLAGTMRRSYGSLEKYVPENQKESLVNSLFPDSDEWKSLSEEVTGYKSKKPGRSVIGDALRIAILSDDYKTTRKFVELIPKYSEKELSDIGHNTYVAIVCNSVDTANRELDALAHPGIQTLAEHFSGDRLNIVRKLVIGDSRYFRDGEPEASWDPVEDVGSIAFAASHDYIKEVIAKFPEELQEKAIRSILSSASYKMCGPSIVAESLDQESVYQLLDNFSDEILDDIFFELGLEACEQVDPEEIDRIAKFLNSDKVLDLSKRYSGKALESVYDMIIESVFTRPDPDSGERVADTLDQDYLDQDVEPGFTNALTVAECTNGDKDAVRNIYEISPEIDVVLFTEWAKALNHHGVVNEELSLYEICSKAKTMKGKELISEINNFVEKARNQVKNNDDIHKGLFDNMKRRSKEDKELEKYPTNSLDIIE